MLTRWSGFPSWAWGSQPLEWTEEIQIRWKFISICIQPFIVKLVEKSTTWAESDSMRKMQRPPLSVLSRAFLRRVFPLKISKCNSTDLIIFSSVVLSTVATAIITNFRETIPYKSKVTSQSAEEEEHLLFTLSAAGLEVEGRLQAFYIISFFFVSVFLYFLTAKILRPILLSSFILQQFWVLSWE